MIEREMEYRGSKSIANFIYPNTNSKVVIVKEQRVDGSYTGTRCTKISPVLRCTLMGLERGYQVRAPSNQEQSRYYSINTLNLPSGNIDKPLHSTADSITHTLNPWFITGFTDAEGCFSIYVRNKSNSSGSKYYCEAKFDISLHKKDFSCLKDIKAYFGGAGSIVKHGEESIRYTITSVIEIINVVIPHFDKYPLITRKFIDYQLFKKAVALIANKEHLTVEGLQKIVTIKASMNRRSLSDELKKSFTDIVPLPLSECFALHTIDPEIPNPNWVAGFTSGDGSFMVKVSKSKLSKLGVGVQLIFQITQHSRDKVLMNSFISYFGCGRLVEAESSVNFLVTKFSDIKEKILPFFQKYPVVGEKFLNYTDWSKVVEIVKNKDHLTHEGLDQILEIKARLNRNRPGGDA